MTQTLPTPAQCFDTNLVAMVTPFEADGSVSREGTVALVKHLVATGCDGIVVAGTTGESPTLTADELADLIALVRATADGRARITVGIGTYDTAESVEKARLAEAAGADALLLVAPYYSKPTQAGLIAHCTDVADATMLPVMLYDIPGRTGVEFQTATLVELSQHPRIRAVKDAKGDLYEATKVMAQTSLEYYSGIDELNLAYLSVGATGVVSVIGNAVADRNAALIAAVRAADLETARTIHTGLIPIMEAIMRTSQGAIQAKVALHQMGVIPTAAVRRPLVEGPVEDVARITAILPDLRGDSAVVA